MDTSWYLLTATIAKMYELRNPVPGDPNYKYKPKSTSETTAGRTADVAPDRSQSIPHLGDSTLRTASPAILKHGFGPSINSASGSQLSQGISCGSSSIPDVEEFKQSGMDKCQQPVHTTFDATGAKPELLEQYDGNYPMVVLQLPMYNEEAHYERLMRNASTVIWPRDRLLIQVGDDSTKEHIQEGVRRVAAELLEEGQPIQVVRRMDRKGYKAGSLVSGMSQFPADRPAPEFTAIFDADFVIPEDFLLQTVYHMQLDSQLAFVQGCWTHSNVDSFLTWCQAVGLDYHFAVEQRARGHRGAFFGFNGTAGTWRLKAIEESGNWHLDTTVEDMDLSIRAYAAGWKFKYLHHVKCPSELPSTFAAWRTQQYRWTAGPMQVVKKSIKNTVNSSKLSWLDKGSAIWFFSRYVINVMVMVVSQVVPLCLMLLPMWGADWKWNWPETMLVVASNFFILLFSAFTTFGAIPYTLWATTTGWFRLYCIFCGIFNFDKSLTWKVTEKTGAIASSGILLGAALPGVAKARVKLQAGAVTEAQPEDKPDANPSAVATPSKRKVHKPYMLEMFMVVYFAGLVGWAAYQYNLTVIVYGSILVVSYTALSFGDRLL